MRASEPTDTCRHHVRRTSTRRIEEAAARRLVEKFRAERKSDADADVAVTVVGETHELSEAEADRLRAALGEALTERREFVRTVGERREDGSYVVSRRRAESSGHRKVFEDFDALRGLYDRLPREFTAEAVGRSGLTGGRRHMLVRHFAEHPAFDCELTSRQPLTASKSGSETGD